MKLFAQIHRIEKEQTFNDGKFKTVKLVLKTVEQYSQVIPIQFENDKIELLKDYSIGQNVEVEFNLKGKEYTKKNGDLDCFITLVGWKISLNK